MARRQLGVPAKSQLKIPKSRFFVSNIKPLKHICLKIPQTHLDTYGVSSI